MIRQEPGGELWIAVGVIPGVVADAFIEGDFCFVSGGFEFIDGLGGPFGFDGGVGESVEGPEGDVFVVLGDAVWVAPSTHGSGGGELPDEFSGEVEGSASALTEAGDVSAVGVVGELAFDLSEDFIEEEPVVEPVVAYNGLLRDDDEKGP